MRKALRIALRLLIGLIAAVVALIVAVLIAIQFKPVRDFGREKGLAAIRGSLKGQLEADDVRWPRLDRIEIYGVLLKDRQGVVVLSASSLIANLELRPLLAGKIEVQRFDADHLYVDLADLGDQTGLLSVFASDEPRAPPKPDQGDSGISPIDVRIRSLCLEEGEVRLQLEAARRLSLRRINSCLDLGIGRSLDLALGDFNAELRQNDRPVLVLVKPSEVLPLTAAAAAAPPRVTPPAPAPIAPAAPPESKSKRRGGAAAERRAAEQRAEGEAKPREPIAPAPAILPTPALPTAAGPMRVALAGKARFRTSYDLGADLWVLVRGFDADTLKALNVDASTLKADSPVDADLHVAAVGQRVNYRLEVCASDSALGLSGELNAQRVLFTHVASPQLELASFTTLELPRLSFELDSQIDLSDPSRELRAQLNLVRGAYGELELPQVSLQARRRGDGTTTLRSLEARYGGALLSADGVLSPDGSVKANAKLVVPELGALPPLRPAGLHGVLAADLRLQLAASAPLPQPSAAGRPPAAATPPGRSPGATPQPAAAEQRLDAELKLTAHDLALQENKIRALTLTLKAEGSVERPIVLAKLTARELRVAGEALGQADVMIDGGPDRYRVSAQVDERRLSLEGWVLRDAPAWEAGLQLSSDIADAPATAELPLLRFIPGSGLEIHELRARFLDASLFADGQIGLGNNQSKLRFGASVPDVAVLTREFAGSVVPGRAELAGSARGQIDQPQIELRLRYLNGPPLAREPSQFELAAQADLKRARVHADFGARAGAARVQAKLDTRWQRNQPLAAAISAADHDLQLDLSGLSLAALTQPADPDMRSRFDGWIAGHVSVKGNPKKLKLETKLTGSRVRMVGDPTSLDVALGAKYADAQFDLEVQVGDRRGQFAKLAFGSAFAVERMIAHPPSGTPVDLIKNTQWNASAEFAERMLRELPIVSGGDFGRELSPLTIATHAKIDHQPGAEPVGELESKLRWRPQPDLDQWSSCSERANGEITLTGKLQNGLLGIELNGGTTSKDAIAIALAMRARMGELLGGAYDGLGPLKLNAHVKQLELASLPLLCERGAGAVSLDIAGEDLFYQLAKFQLGLDIRGLRWDLSPSLDITSHAHAQANTLNIDAELTSGAGKLRIDGQLPIGFQTKDPALVVNRGGPLLLKTRFQQVDLASLLAYVPAVARVSGTVDGAIDLNGKLQEPVAKGSLRLNDVSLTLPRLGQRFAHVQLEALLDGRRLRLRDGKVKDLDGSASLAAAFSLDSIDAWTAEINLRARNFPLRKSGVMMGRVDADANVVAKSDPKQTHVEVRLNNTSINLTTQEIASVQSLDRNPEIVFTDSPPPALKEEESEPATGPPPHVQINVITDEPLWIRRDDFAVQMSAALYVAIGDEAPSLTGKIDLLRGYITLMGQNFDIKSGKVVLTGGANIDPQLEIKATHDLSNGGVVTLEVSGFVHAPKLQFYLNDQQTEAGEALYAIMGVTGGGGGSSFESQVASAAIGMTTGLLTLGARREFGDWIPMLSVEQGDQTKVRVGFEADKLIPSFMRGFVKGAYVEGIVAGQNQNPNGTPTTGASTNTAAGGGVLLELMLPRNFVWAGQYGPGTAWSVDLDYRP